MGKDPSTIRKDIEHTREHMGDTVDALAYKSDVGARAKESVTSRVESVKSAVDSATPSTNDVRLSARRAVGIAQRNPIGLAIGATAVGFLAGMLIPSTSLEDEKLGPAADQVRDHAKEAAQVAVEHGKETAKAAVDAAQDAGREQAGDLGSDLREEMHRTQQDLRS